MKDTLKVAGFQMRVEKDVVANEKRILGAIEKAASESVDFLVTPEGSLSGYWTDFDRRKVAEALSRVTNEAKKAKVGLMLGTCYKELIENKEYCYNQVRVYTPAGDYLGFHAKILRCSSLALPGTGEMRQYVEGQLRTFQWKGVTFGILICNDLWATPGFTTIPNPYLPWQLKKMGADVIFHSIYAVNDQQYRPFHESSVELWAKALEIHILEVNAAADDGQKVSAQSGLVGPQGQRLVKVNDVEQQFFNCGIQC